MNEWKNFLIMNKLYTEEPNDERNIGWNGYTYREKHNNINQSRLMEENVYKSSFERKLKFSKVSRTKSHIINYPVIICFQRMTNKQQHLYFFSLITRKHKPN